MKDSKNNLRQAELLDARRDSTDQKGGSARPLAGLAAKRGAPVECGRVSSNTWEPLLTPIEAAQLLRVHPKTALRLARAHHLPGVKLGKHWRFRQCDLTAWVESHIESDCQPSDCQEE